MKIKFISIIKLTAVFLISCTSISCSTHTTINNGGVRDTAKPNIHTFNSERSVGTFHRQYVKGFGENESYCRPLDSVRFFQVHNKDLPGLGHDRVKVIIERTTVPVSSSFPADKQVSFISYELAPGTAITFNTINSCAYTLNGASGPQGIRSIHQYEAELPFRSLNFDEYL
ncbi:hypothetical protein [Alteromonas mediterranea]|jgi:hypothetical protein|uniref:Lipoprotein n=1 Tax=Alteromonas mediterranea TaxID=314275 RepID=A0AAC8XL64_9ALTE|nr:hypothetical protein [Alteromonas mediterranea]AGP94556.1 hypothetical protein I634_14305 [Alteromonas mediterranea U8]AFV86434.1 hypothetical protein amad1_14690 [Alteromonas mediterranea DE1]AGP86563.1 hypothetical protein I607_13890 [Alteromonas mediterranea U4]AGP90725.1 hypothetical protein I876_14390 [Alteromonas mediterranea U7]AGP98446.1 hypothetical protein I635_14665 [Alteromonas mediterranea UM7]|tara:strand:- start:2 stop:514 length:513 start_codon:yes stop_codon:yes gene_type:complete